MRQVLELLFALYIARRKLLGKFVPQVFDVWVLLKNCVGIAVGLLLHFRLFGEACGPDAGGTFLIIVIQINHPLHRGATRLGVYPPPTVFVRTRVDPDPSTLYWFVLGLPHCFD